MLKSLTVICRRFASSGSGDSSRKLVLWQGGAIAAWHPPQKFPYECSRPVELQAETSINQNSRLSSEIATTRKHRDPLNTELKDIFYTTKHEWHTRSREERLRKVAATIPRRK